MRFTPAETQAYLAAQATELAKLAKEANLQTLEHLFAMASLEARGLQIQVPTPKAA